MCIRDSVRTYRSNNNGFGNSFRYEISKGHGGGGRSYRGKINLILAYNRKLTNQEVQEIYQSLSPRLNGTETSLTVSSTSSQTSIDEEVSIGTEAGKLTATDSDTTNLTYSLVSCLLYTSPSPRDVEESRMPSSA